MSDRRQAVNSACESMCDAVLRLDKDINGNGQPGMKQTLQKINENMAAMRGAQDERDRATDKRHFWVMAMLSVLTIAVALMAVPAIAHAFHVGELKVPSFLQRKQSGEVYTGRMNRQPESSVLPDSEVRNALTVNSQGEQTQDIF